MSVLYDSSVLVAGLVEAHPQHEQALPWLRDLVRGKKEVVLASHSLAEVYATLTVLPVRPRISPVMARQLIRDNTAKAKTLSLSPSEYRRTLDRAAELNLQSGAVYDALIAAVAEKAGVEKLVTFNLRDFHRVWPEGREQITSP